MYDTCYFLFLFDITESSTEWEISAMPARLHPIPSALFRYSTLQLGGSWHCTFAEESRRKIGIGPCFQGPLWNYMGCTPVRLAHRNIMHHNDISFISKTIMGGALASTNVTTDLFVPYIFLDTFRSPLPCGLPSVRGCGGPLIQLRLCLIMYTNC